MSGDGFNDGHGDQRSPDGTARPLAVSLRHDEGRARVTAKGRGAVAEQILAIAFAQGIKVREDRDLAEVLAAIDVDCEIPLVALAAVAAILERLYQANAVAEGRP